MNNTLRHRGPDDGGLWVDSAVGLLLANRRLAILDLSPAGHQPMISQCGRYVIAYNGEVYNFLEIRQELEKRGHQFRSTSDTEVLLEAWSVWGKERTMARLNGMFSFALWDREERALTLARDRLGEKPLFYGWCRNTFLFGSELRALRQHAHFDGELNRNSVALFLRHGYIPAPYSIYHGIYKLLPGHTLTVVAPQTHASPEPYWCVQNILERATRNRFEGDIREAADELETLLRDSVRIRMLADVPVGAFLSGGIDSSTVVAMMQTQTTSRVKTFTIGFREDSHNEADHSKEIARYLGTEHTELYISAEKARDIIPLLPDICDEPFADPSQIPTFLVSHLARQTVTVTLSGDGGDELFGGYKEYLLGMRRWRMLRCLSPGLSTIIDQATNFFSHLFRDDRPSGERLRNAQHLVKVTTPEVLHQYHVSQWTWPLDLVPGAIEPATVFTAPQLRANGITAIERMMYMDLVTYLPEDILTKLDRASMAVSLEARVPLLDHRLVEFAWQLPLDFKIYRGQSKLILRSILSRYVPRRLFQRPKMGFGIPLGKWLRGPLRSWAEELLNPTALQAQGIFNAPPIRHKWMDHLSGKQNRATQLWAVLMFQAWQERWM